MFQYRCGSCRASAPLSRTRREAEEVRERHRATVHGGLVPDGEELLSVPGGVPGGPAGAGADGVRYVSSRRALAALAALAGAAALARIFGR